MRIKLGAIAGAFALATLLPAAPLDAAPAKELHCAARVIDKKDTGELVLGETVCRGSRSEAVADVSGGPAAKSTVTIGTHYDGASLTGSSFSVVGSDCGGGWLNVNSSWDNRISSTWNGCPRITHFDGDNLTGAAESTYGMGGNLIGLNNRTNSIQYTS